MTTELRNLDYKRFPSSSLLISCALCEGALSFLINKTKDHEHQMIKTLEMDKPRNWKFPGLIKAASSGTNPVLKDEKLRHSLEKMNDHRKRIHPAAFFPEAGGIPDLKPEQAKTAIDTTEELSRAIIDWSLQNLKQ